jgi:hypothetical protein
MRISAWEKQCSVRDKYALRLLQRKLKIMTKHLVAEETENYDKTSYSSKDLL